MKILLIGGNGQVGHELRRSLAPLGEVVVTTRTGHVDGAGCELLDIDQLDTIGPLVARIRPQVIVNAAAYTAVDRAEDDSEAAFRANAEAPALMAEACAACDALLVHYSTDYIFDGRSTRPYREDDPPSPLGVYGASKLAGEEAIRRVGVDHVILRTAWVYASHGKNFLITMLKLAAAHDTLRVVADQFGSPTPAGLIADVTARVLERRSTSGTWHLAAGGGTTWHGFAEAIFDRAVAMGLLSLAPRVIPIAGADYPTRAIRPGYSRLDTDKLKHDFQVQLPPWREGLDKILCELAPVR